MKYASFLATSYLTFTNEPCQLWSYGTEFHEIFTRYTGIIYADIAIRFLALVYRMQVVSVDVDTFLQYYLVAMATSLDKVEQKKLQIHHLHVMPFHMVYRLRKSVE